MKNKILITGIGGPAGKSAVSYFQEKGFFIIGTDVREIDIKADAFFIVPLATDNSFAPRLLEIIVQQKPALFIPTVTEELLIVSELKKEIERHYCSVFISRPDAVAIANDKLRTAVFMEKNNISVPRTFDEMSPRELIVKELGLPLLVKPCVGRGGRGVTVYRTAEEVYHENREGIMFQEFIPGDEFDVNLFIDKEGEVLASVALEKTVLKDGLVGNALEVERTSRDDVIRLSEQAAGKLGMQGPLDFDIRLRNDGTPVLLEINARLGGNALQAKEVLDCLADAVKQKMSQTNSKTKERTG